MAVSPSMLMRVLVTWWVVSVDELAELPVIHLAGEATPTADLPPGPVATTLQEALTLVGIGHGVLPIGAHAQRYHARPDVTYLPLRDTPQLEWRLVWLADRTNARIRAFTAAALTFTGDRP
ncbi:hypothetical protein [Nocardia africana]|uniref:hypothetical protein n=1 Tax=Nocardia africana TaxID=134964 RepID=UPI001C3FDBA3|nr:hypothetical protein [Nocardia africana]MCC3313756.1 hypothetical protein [Nocardia africana]